MEREMFVSLAYNAAMLLALSVILDSATKRNYRNTILAQIATGLGLSAIVLAIMIFPWKLRPGVVFDTRTILLSLSAMFFGFVPTAMAAITAIVYRLSMGGAGALVGCGTIVASSAWGLLWRERHSKVKKPYGFWELYSLGFLVNLSLVYIMLGIPYPVGFQVAKSIFLPVIIIYPLATVALGQILARRVKRRELELQMIKLKSDWEIIFQSIPHPTLILDKDQKVLAVNKYLEEATKLRAEEMIGRYCWSFMHGDDLGIPHVNCPFSDSCSPDTNTEVEADVQAMGGWYQVSCKPIYDSYGNIERVIHIAMDVTLRKKAEQVLAESESKYRLLAESAQDCIFLHDLEGKFSYANKVGLAFLGVNEDEISSVSFFKYIPKEYHRMVKQNAQDRIAGFTAAKTYQMEIYNSLAERRSVEINSVAVIDNDKVIGVQEVVRDITDRIAAQKALQESEHRFQMFMDNLPGGAFIKDSHSRVLYLNKYMMRNFNVGDRIGKHPSEIYDADMVNRIITEDQRVMAMGTHHAIERQPHADGTLHLYDTTKFALLNPHGENLLGGISLDITQKYMLEEQQKRYAKRLEILRNLDSIVLESLSFEKVCDEAIQRLQEIIPFSVLCVCVLKKDKVNIASLYNPNDRYDYLQKDEDYLFNNDFVNKLVEQRILVIDKPEDMEDLPDMPIRSRLKAEGMKSFLYIALLTSDKTLGFIMFASEILAFFKQEFVEIADEFASQISIVINQMNLLDEIRSYAQELEFKVRERTTQLQSANKELEAFAYTVAHDLRAPLRSIEGFSTALIEDYYSDLPPQAREHLEIIVKSTNRMDTLIRELLHMAKMNNSEMQRKKANMKKLAEAALNLILGGDDAKDFKIVLGDLHECNADPTMMSQVWQNIIENAVKFSLPSGRKHISIGSYTKNDEIIYFVQDHGLGFDPRLADKMFGLFQRLHSDETIPGTGIGLAVVEKIVLRHGGRIWADTELGGGTTLFFSLPMHYSSS